MHLGPGSFLEVAKIIHLLTKGGDSQLPVFDVVAISLPGYAFSEGPKKKGFSMVQSRTKLMLSLGYNEYVTQGGDWGFGQAWHTNFPITGPPPNDDLNSYTPAEQEGLARLANFERFESGYFKQQSTRPQTLVLLDCLPGFMRSLSGGVIIILGQDDEVLTWVSIYWFSRAGPTASLRIYYEVMNSGQGFNSLTLSTVPTIPMGSSLFPKESVRVPKSWYPRIGNSVFEVEHDSGGHFAAYEKPEML
ncbi:alpha/beta-hydrolase, partial [Gymnopus androsaceus JB14]